MPYPLARAVALALATTAVPALATTDIEMLQERLARMEQETAALRAELELVKQESPQKAAARDAAAPVSVATAATAKGHRVFFRGGYAALMEDRADGAFTDMNDVTQALGLPPTRNTSDDGWYFGGGFDFLLSHDSFGLLPGTWALAELGLEFRDLGSEDVHLVGPVAECLLLANLGAGAATGCVPVVGKENLMMLTVSASPKLKFNEGGKLRPWLIPAGLDLNVISPPSDSTNYLDIGVQFAGGLDYEILPGITLGADVRYHLAANLTDPDYSPASVAAASAMGLTLNTDPSNDAWTAGVSLGIGF